MMVDQFFLYLPVLQKSIVFQFLLIFLFFVFALIGGLYVLKAFFSPSLGRHKGKHHYKRPMTIAFIGVIFLIISGIFLIFLYSLYPSTYKPIDNDEDLPDISQNFKNGEM